jgi:hypothetical protein
VDEHTDFFVLIANPSSSAATVRVTLGGGASGTREYRLAPRSRANAWIDADFAPPSGTRFTVTAEADTDIVVEHATYWDANGEWWAGGSAAMAVPQMTTAIEASFTGEGVRRHSWGSLPEGAQPVPLELDDLALDFLVPGTLTVTPAGDQGLGPVSLSASIAYGNDLVITFPPGVHAAGFRLIDYTAFAGSARVMAIDRAGSGVLTGGGAEANRASSASSRRRASP